MTRHTFHRSERLKSKKEIDQLFSGQSPSFGQYPLRLVWCPRTAAKSDFPVQTGFSVPKRRFKHAVTRNLIKRRMREAYRLHKHRLYDGLTDEPTRYSWMLLYVGKEIHSYESIEQATLKIIRRFLKYRQTDQ